MILWQLKRVIYRPECTLGVLTQELEPLALICEDPMHWNQSGVSAIPAGSYYIEWYNSPTHGMVFIIKDVPGRTFIEMHVGNTPKDTLGCLLVGKSFSYFADRNEWGVTDSANTMEALKARMKDQTRWLLQIVDSI